MEHHGDEDIIQAENERQEAKEAEGWADFLRDDPFHIDRIQIMPLEMETPPTIEEVREQAEREWERREERKAGFAATLKLLRQAE